ncbi:MAG: MBL fold metallo-hydrolase [Chloroflexi bacterium]|nr:MBL fold metallo-hydrolase [Chloroflexota bacterium]
MPQVELLLTGYALNTDQVRLGLCTVSLIRGRNTIVVDTSPHGRRERLVNVLRERGLSPGDVDMVVLTHAHWDHCHNVDVFPRATVVIHPKELEYTRNPNPKDWATASYFPRMLEGRQVKEVTEGATLEPGVRIVETPGHTRGHISVLVTTPQGDVAITGDSLTGAASVFIGKPFLIFWSEQEAEASVRKLLGLTHTFYPGHDRPFTVEGDRQVSYLGGDVGLRVFGHLGYGLGDVSLTVGVEPPRQVWALK